MAIDCNSPCSPYEDEVKTVLDSLVVNRIKSVALDRWNSGKDGSAAPTDTVAVISNIKHEDNVEMKVPSHEDDQPELHASDISNATDDGLGTADASFSSSMNGSLRVSSLALNASGGVEFTESLQASMETSTASFADSSSALEQPTSSRASKMERRKNKRLNKKKQKYSQLLASSNEKNTFTLGDLINDLQGEQKQQFEEEDGNSLHQSFPAPRGSCSGVTLADLITDLQAEDTAEDCKTLNESFPAPRGSRSNKGRTTRGSGSGSGEATEVNKAPIVKRTSTTNRSLPRKSKSMDDSDKERFKARRNSLLNEAEKAKRATLSRAASTGKVMPPRRHRMQRSYSGKKVLDGLAAISAHASTAACPNDIGRKVKLQRALSDVGKLCRGVLDSSSNESNNNNSSTNNNNNDMEVSPVKSDRRRNIKRTFSNLGRSQSRLMEENRGKSPVPVRMPSRRNMAAANKRLPTTTVTNNRIPGSKISSIAAAAGVTPRATQSFSAGSNRRAEKKINMDDLSGSVHGTISTCASRRRAHAAKLSKSERNLSAEEYDLSNAHSQAQPTRKSCGSCRRETSSSSGSRSTKDEMSRSVHGTSSTRETPRRDRRSRAAAAVAGSAPFNWKKFAGTSVMG